MSNGNQRGKRRLDEDSQLKAPRKKLLRRSDVGDDDAVGLFPTMTATPTLDGVAAAIVTDAPDANVLRVVERAVVVTVTTTQANESTEVATPSKSGELPLGIIIGSVAVGVVIAIAVVGGWIWWGKRIERQGKKVCFHCFHFRVYLR